MGPQCRESGSVCGYHCPHPQTMVPWTLGREQPWTSCGKPWGCQHRRHNLPGTLPPTLGWTMEEGADTGPAAPLGFSEVPVLPGSLSSGKGQQRGPLPQWEETDGQPHPRGPPHILTSSTFGSVTGTHL